MAIQFNQNQLTYVQFSLTSLDLFPKCVVELVVSRIVFDDKLHVSIMLHMSVFFPSVGVSFQIRNEPEK